MTIVPSEQDIDQLLNRCVESEESGISAYPGMTYEQGIKAAIEYIQTGEYPFD